MQNYLKFLFHKNREDVHVLKERGRSQRQCMYTIDYTIEVLSQNGVFSSGHYLAIKMVKELEQDPLRKGSTDWGSFTCKKKKGKQIGI